MAVTTQGTAPYTTGSAVVGIIQRYRDKGLPAPINEEVLERSSVVSGTLIPRTLQSLRILELIDENGMPTPTFQKIRSVPESEYKTTLSEWLRSVYADVFTFVDPAKDSSVQVRDAFRGYVPHGQQDRMVSLFLALCTEAGIAGEVKKSDAPMRKQVSVRTANIRAKQQPRQPSKQEANSGGRSNFNNSVPLPPALAGLVQSIPAPTAGWTKADRDLFITTFGAVLDFCIPIKTAAQIAEESKEEDESA